MIFKHIITSSPIRWPYLACWLYLTPRPPSARSSSAPSSSSASPAHHQRPAPRTETCLDGLKIASQQPFKARFRSRSTVKSASSLIGSWAPPAMPRPLASVWKSLEASAWKVRSELREKQAQHMLTACQKHAKSMPKACQKHAKSMLRAR